ncbi:sensor histidine kinase [Lachnotalea glycerini]|uniref:histidine kinase n=1 Tax=Lachnotalea glycerini TaxID=1763509 RepID=A0A371JH43_9FIRM|nr:HAMP domain-containing sensor histidine kinase [Lachnotalea glycerini]RDY32053.1 sensor histidine kinase [Lachnotalea glycerini]
MKKLTIKMKITIWFTVFMIILSTVVFVFIALISNSTVSQETRGMLISLVEDNTREVEYDDGEVDIDDDFVSFSNGVYCLVFDSTGKKFSGYAPYTELESQTFENANIRSVSIGKETYLIYDQLITSKKHADLWVRGVVLESGNAITSSAVYRAVLIMLPILIILAAVGGYMFAGRSLHPIKKISKTAEDIGSSGDLSKRIDIDNNGDELYQLAQTFNRMFARLEKNFEAERSFTSDASHELRTPVATILAQCEYAFENASGEQELYEAIGAIQKQGYRISHLIESLLQFTRMEQQTEVISFETVELSKLVSYVCKEYEEIGEKGITLTKFIQPDIIYKVDRTLFSRMLENLIRNAFRYGKDNGTITVSLKESDNAVILSVADDGIGIAPDELSKIWNRFYRADKSRSFAKGTGLGLGLAMVKQIAELHGGKVQAESIPDLGSVFTVELLAEK